MTSDLRSNFVLALLTLALVGLGVERTPPPLHVFFVNNSRKTHQIATKLLVPSH